MDTIHLTNQEQQTVNYYNQQGKGWVEQQSPVSFWAQEIETFKQLLPTGKIIEIGVGAGLEAQLLLNQKTYDYVGIDISPTMLAMAQQRNPEAKFMEASLHELPFSSDTFDGFWAALVFLHVPKNRIDQALLSLTKVLKKNACGFISLKGGYGEETDKETNRFFSYFTSDEFTNILKKHHFIVEKNYERKEIKRIKEHTWLVFFVTYKP